MEKYLLYALLTARLNTMNKLLKSLEKNMVTVLSFNMT